MALLSAKLSKAMLQKLSLLKVTILHSLFHCSYFLLSQNARDVLVQNWSNSSSSQFLSAETIPDGPFDERWQTNVTLSASAVKVRWR